MGTIGTGLVVLKFLQILTNLQQILILYMYTNASVNIRMSKKEDCKHNIIYIYEHLQDFYNTVDTCIKWSCIDSHLR
jgi:hypothetical protein